MQVTQEVTKDFPDIDLPNGLNVIAGLLYVPLSSGGKDFIAFLRKGQLRDVSWAGRPKSNVDGSSSLEPRGSFRVRSVIMKDCFMFSRFVRHGRRRLRVDVVHGRMNN